MSYRRDLWEIAAENHGVVTVPEAEDAGVPAVEVRKLAHRGALRAYGKGVYVHRDVPVDDLTQPAVATALAGNGAFLQREAVLDLLGLGQFNPHRIRVASRRRVRRMLPDWIELEIRVDIEDGDLTRYEGIPATTVRRALDDVYGRIPVERWATIVDQAWTRDLIDDRELAELNARERPVR
ncbi:type IV toxin-antitoxin system AbiEi family antitoxin domain-containing protein [Arthrobacter sp. RAF14]|uniref:type IV toxin-antitoxin system AbiEi family antitoxin domain-containing protein n=1 Tax=Arthrobacter sp. RAF14 TaxID=3233051 RepID=UPI003F9069CC